MAARLLDARALALAALTLVLALPAPARAEVAVEACAVDHLERYLGEACVACPASAEDPEACRTLHEPAGRRQRCFTATEGGRWEELWCLPRADAEPAIPPPAAAEPEGHVPSDTVADARAEPAPAASPAAPAGDERASGGCGCASGGGDGGGGGPALALALALVLGRRRSPRA